MAHPLYNYDNRYLADVWYASYSGSLKMPVGDKYRVYPAVSVAWIKAPNEEWCISFSVLDCLKLRASFWMSTGYDSRLFL